MPQILMIAILIVNNFDRGKFKVFVDISLSNFNKLHAPSGYKYVCVSKSLDTDDVRKLQCIHIDRRIKLMWVTSHKGLSGNENADRLAKN